MCTNFYTVSDISEKLMVHKKTVQLWIRTGELKAVKLGKSYRISEDQLQEYLKKNTTK